MVSNILFFLHLRVPCLGLLFLASLESRECSIIYYSIQSSIDSTTATSCACFPIPVEVEISDGRLVVRLKI